MVSKRRLRLASLAITLTGTFAASCSSDLGQTSAPCEATSPLPGPPEHALCGWLYEHPDDADTELAYDTFAAHAADFDAVHPKWWHVATPTTLENHPGYREEPYHGFHDRRVLDHTTRGGAPTRLIPLVGATSPSEITRVHVMINDPALRAAHVAALSRLVEDNDYDGLDLDYEHIRGVLDVALPKRTIAQERAAMSAFFVAVAQELHAHGREISLAIPVNFSANSEFDLELLSRTVDEIHVMGYDYHYEGGDHAGPTAPLGWIQHFIDQVATIDGGRRSSRFILGLANYGLYGPPSGAPVQGCEPMARCFDLFCGDYETTTDELGQCSGGSDSGRSPNVLLPDGERLYFEDLASLEEKVAAARAGGFGGITYWGIGGEPETPGPLTFFQMVRSHFPRSGADDHPG
jgi:spore germination protein YaaH